MGKRGDCAGGGDAGQPPDAIRDGLRTFGNPVDQGRESIGFHVRAFRGVAQPMGPLDQLFQEMGDMVVESQQVDPPPSEPTDDLFESIQIVGFEAQVNTRVTT